MLDKINSLSSVVQWGFKKVERADENYDGVVSNLKTVDY